MVLLLQLKDNYHTRHPAKSEKNVQFCQSTSSIIFASSFYQQITSLDDTAQHRRVYAKAKCLKKMILAFGEIKFAIYSALFFSFLDLCFIQ